MNKVSVKLQVYFEDPFWVGICERIVNEKLSACKIVFGSEPKDYEISKYILDNWYGLKFSPTVEELKKQKDRINPKRLQRSIKKQISNIGVGTKSQQALKLQQEEKNITRKAKTRLQKREEQERLFALKQQKRKEKHKGR